MRADLHRVAADEELAIVLDGADHRLLAAGQAALAPAEDALVGLDLDDQLVADADPDRDRADGGDLQFAVIHAAVRSDPPLSVGLERHFGLAVEEVHALLVELEPDLLVGRDGDVGGTLTIDDRAPNRNAWTKVMSPVGSTV